MATDQGSPLISASTKNSVPHANPSRMGDYRLSKSTRELLKESYEDFILQLDAAFPLLAIAGGLLLWSLASVLEGTPPAAFVVMRLMQLMFGAFGLGWGVLKLIRRFRK